jgi:23S rRNA (pseudouridine1915-N3)-methyltransferase
LFPLIRIRLIAVGKDKDTWISDGCAHFEKLLSRYANCSWTILPSEKGAKGLTPSEIKKREAKRITEKLKKGLHIALADSGRSLDSDEFARQLEIWQGRSGGVISFIIGGAYGLDASILNGSDYVLSLSPMTFSHQVVRLVLLEQLYRGFSILHNSDYHK